MTSMDGIHTYLPLASLATSITNEHNGDMATSVRADRFGVALHIHVAGCPGITNRGEAEAPTNAPWNSLGCTDTS